MSPSSDPVVLSTLVQPAPPPMVKGKAPFWRAPIWRTIFTGLLLVALALLAFELWQQSRTVSHLSREVARRSAASEALALNADRRSAETQAAQRTLTEKLAVLDARVAESRGQQAALEKLYQDLLRGQDDWLMVEVDQTLNIASQQLALAGNVSSAVAALQVADARLARADHPQFIPVRRAINKDLDRLRALPAIDIAGSVLRIDRLMTLLDQVPLLADAPSSARTEKTAAANEAAAAANHSTWAGLVHGWRRFSSAVAAELKALMRVREASETDALLLSPKQSAWWRENLKLRLLNARLALLSRQESAYRADLAAVSSGLERYADTTSVATRAAQQQLRQLMAVAVAVELPSLNDSLSALRALRYRQDDVPR